MAVRFRKSFKLMPGVKLNVGKRGISTTVGVRGFSVNTSKRGSYMNVGIPGTGLSTRAKIAGSAQQSHTQKPPRVLNSSFKAVGKMLYILAALLTLWLSAQVNSDMAPPVSLAIIIALVVIRFNSKAHKAKQQVKIAEKFCQVQQYPEALTYLTQAYDTYPVVGIKHDIDYLTQMTQP